MHRTILAPVVIWMIVLSSTLLADDQVSRTQALATLQRGIEFYRTKVSVEGGYLWRYAADFSEREGERPASATTAWVQPPGTPTVGIAYLTAYQLTGEPECLEAAKESAVALVRGQLQSGGWEYRIEFAPEDRKKLAFRVDALKDPESRRNQTTLDDNTTQAALSFLMRMDHALRFEHEQIHEAIRFALDSLLAAQYPNGAWPQRYSETVDPKDYPVLKASYPESWNRQHPKLDYRSYYTFNDDTMADMIELMFLAAEIYGADEYREAGLQAGEFILLAQMPDPQPGWAQQYNVQMQPAWARRFEPPSITGSESQRVMEVLLRLFEVTGDRKFLEPLPRALDYFKNSQLDDGRLARFYELKTNRPLYFTKDYQLTYSDDDLPTHYGFKANNRLDRIEKRYNYLASMSDDQFRPVKVFQPSQAARLSRGFIERVSEIIKAQDAQGAWIEPASSRARSKIPVGAPAITSRTFCENIAVLAEYIAAKQSSAGAE